MRRYALLGLSVGSLVVLAACGGSGGTAPQPAASPSPTASASPTPSPSSSPSPSPTPSPAASGEIFALADPGETTASIQRYLAMPDVSGVAWRGLWRVLEPSDGAYAWGTLDAALDAAAGSGKRITIHVLASGGGWPSWLTTAGATTYTASSLLGGTITDPVPWDPVYLARYERLMQQLAAHVAARGQTEVLRLVSVAAPVSEMSLAGCMNGMLGTVTYDRTQYLSAWTRSASAVVAAFPATSVAVSAPVTQICAPDGDGSAFYAEVMRSAPLANIFVADLNALGSQRYGQVAADVRARSLFAQTIWSSTNDPNGRMQGTLSAAACAGRGLGARYFELYKSDLDSSDATIRTAIAQARGTASCP